MTFSTVHLAVASTSLSKAPGFVNALSLGENRFMLQVIGRKGQHRPHIVLCNLGVSFEYILNRPAGTQLAQDQLYGDAGPLDAGLTHHDARVGGDARI